MQLDLATVDKALTEAERALERERGVVQSLAAKGQAAIDKAGEAKIVAEACEEASQLLAKYADERQAEVLSIIEKIASVGLSQVFEEPIELKITQVVRARRVEMDVLLKTGELETPIMDARGGGVAAVAGFLLRASVKLLTPDERRLMMLDEVFAHLSEEYVPRMADFLAELSEKSAMQIILVTHQPEFADAAHNVVRIEKVAPNTSRFVQESK